MEPHDLLTYRAWLMRIVLTLAIVVMPLAFIITIPMLIQGGNHGLVVLDIAFWLAILIYAISRRGSYIVDVLLWFALLYLMTGSFFIALGPHHARPAWLVFITVMGALTFGVRGTVAAATINAAFLVTLYWVLAPDNPVWTAELATPNLLRVMFIVNVTILSLAAGLPVGFLLDRFHTSLVSQREALDRLSTEQENLQLAYGSLEGEVAERRKIEDSLRQSEERYRLLAENVADTIWLIDPTTTHFAYVSPAAEATLGYTAEELIGRSVMSILTLEGQERLATVIANELPKSTEDPLRITKVELELRRKEGSTVWVEVIARVLYVDWLSSHAILGVTRDISERKAAEAERR
ncbi:MAG: PAS domain S-box protein, partial [Deltaproteobacteria bacterium]|nr:PAS domain S-box protein [Deltaproteobacteria bacterium]